MSSSLALNMQGVEFRRNRRVILTDVSWRIGVGEKWVLFGPNGIGKSTLVQMMSTRNYPSLGSVDILGRRLGKVDVFSYRHLIGLSSQELAGAFPSGEDPLDAVLGALTNTIGRWRQTYTPSDIARARTLMARFGIDYAAGSTMGVLSDGERTRVLICRCLMNDPQMLILDEPTTGLDLGGRELVLSELTKLSQEDSSRTIVLVTHRLEEIPAGFDHIALMGRAEAKQESADQANTDTTGVDQGNADHISNREYVYDLKKPQSQYPAPGTLVYSGPIEQGLTSDYLQQLFGVPFALSHAHGRWSAVALR